MRRLWLSSACLMLAHLACEPGAPPEQPTEGVGLGLQQKALSEEATDGSAALAQEGNGGSTFVCDGQPVDLLTHPRHCGMCGRECPTGATCQRAMCSCPPLQNTCAGACTNLSTDPGNCGACGRACPQGDSCETCYHE